MEQPNNNFKVLSGILAAVLVISIAAGIYYWDRSRDLAEEKERVEIQANSLLSGQSQDLDKLNKKIAAINQEKSSLTTQLDQLNQSLDQNNTRFANLNTTYRSATTALNRFKDSLETQRLAWTDQAKILADTNASYVSRNTALDQELTSLRDQMQRMVPASVITVDGFRVKAVKQNNKETAKAKKVHTLMISFQVPPHLNLTGSKEVYLGLTDLQGNALLTPLRTVTVSTPDAEKRMDVHAMQQIDFTQKPQRVGFTLETDDEIKPGLYRASVYTKDRYLGAVEFQFRDSFWFF